MGSIHEVQRTVWSALWRAVQVILFRLVQFGCVVSAIIAAFYAANALMLFHHNELDERATGLLMIIGGSLACFGLFFFLKERLHGKWIRPRQLVNLDHEMRQVGGLPGLEQRGESVIELKR